MKHATENCCDGVWAVIEISDGIDRAHALNVSHYAINSSYSNKQELYQSVQQSYQTCMRMESLLGDRPQFRDKIYPVVNIRMRPAAIPDTRNYR